MRRLPGEVRHQKAPTPDGVPRPVGPSHPMPATHHWDVAQVPLLPEVTSLKLPAAFHSVWALAVEAFPASAYTEAMIGDATLVPPKTSHPLTPWYERLSYTATPVLGSATAETSATARLLQ